MSAIKQRTVLEGGTVYNDWAQPNRDRVLQENLELRRLRSSRRLDWGEVALRIPELDLALLKMLDPDLASHDGQIKAKAWKAFLASPWSAPYRVQDRGRNRLRSQGGI